MRSLQDLNNVLKNCQYRQHFNIIQGNKDDFVDIKNENFINQILKIIHCFI